MHPSWWSVVALAVTIPMALVPANQPPSHLLAPDACAQADFTPSLPLSFRVGTSYPFAVDFHASFPDLVIITAISNFAPNDAIDRGDRYYIFNFGGQTMLTGNTSVTEATLIQGDPVVLAEFADGLFTGTYNSEAGNFTLTMLRFCVEEGTTGATIPVDIKPGSCPNPFNVRARGVLPVAILGTRDLDVSRIDPASVRLEGVAPLRHALEDVATPPEAAGCTTDGPDGTLDLSLKFDLPAVASALGSVQDREIRELRVSCVLRPEFGGIPLAGSDVVVILTK